MEKIQKANAGVVMIVQTIMFSRSCVHKDALPNYFLDSFKNDIFSYGKENGFFVFKYEDFVLVSDGVLGINPMVNKELSNKEVVTMLKNCINSITDELQPPLL